MIPLRKKTPKPCSQRQSPRDGCYCQHCQPLRVIVNAKKRANRVAQAAPSAQPRWRCDCGMVSSKTQCPQCQQVPNWAMPEVA